MIVERSRLIRGQSTHIHIEDQVAKRYPASWIVTGSSMQFLLPDGPQAQRVSDPTADVRLMASGEGESLVEATLDGGTRRLSVRFKVVDSSGIASLVDPAFITLDASATTGVFVIPRDADGETYESLLTSWKSTDTAVVSVAWAGFSSPERPALTVSARRVGAAEIIGTFGPARDTIRVSVVP